MESGINVVRSPHELGRHIEAAMRGMGVFIVGVCGIAGSGKTTLCNQLIAMSLVNTVRLDCDLFSSHSHAERQALIGEATRSGSPEQIESVENPRNWYSYERIISALHDLKAKRIHNCERAWNRQTGELDGHYRVALAGDGPAVVLCDCIFLLHPAIRAELDLVVLVETPDEVVIERGLFRSKGDSSRAAYLDRLRRKYSDPYFEMFGSEADIIYQPDI